MKPPEPYFPVPIIPNKGRGNSDGKGTYTKVTSAAYSMDSYGLPAAAAAASSSAVGAAASSSAVAAAPANESISFVAPRNGPIMEIVRLVPKNLHAPASSPAVTAAAGTSWAPTAAAIDAISLAAATAANAASSSAAAAGQTRRR